MKRAYLSIVIVLLCSSCGYHVSSGHQRQVSIAIVRSEYDAILTRELALQLSQNGRYTYNDDGDFELQIDLSPISKGHVGYRYEPIASGEVTQSVAPSESRLIIQAEVTLVDSRTGLVVKGPFKVEVAHEFDYEFFPDFGGVTQFSRGQVDEINLAQEKAHLPLYRKLVRMILNHL